MKSCYVIDIWAGGSNALVSLMPLIQENLHAIDPAAIETALQNSDYPVGPEAILLVRNLVNLFSSFSNSEADQQQLSTLFNELRNQPLAFALLTDVINYTQNTSPPHKLILHCDLGLSTENSIQSHTWEPSDVEMTAEQLTLLKQNVAKHIRSIPSGSLDVLYVGLGHGGDVDGGVNLKRQMAGISEKDWNTLFNILQQNHVEANLLIAESCYSAAYAREFKNCLSTPGIMQLETLEATPSSLDASVRCAQNPQASLYSSAEIGNTLEKARKLLVLFAADKSLTDAISSELAHITEQRIQQSVSVTKKYDISELKSQPQLRGLIDRSSQIEITLNELTAFSNSLRNIDGNFSMWNYYDENTLKLKNNRTIADLKNDLENLVGKTDPATNRLIAVYIKTVQTFMGSYPPPPDPKFPQFMNERRKKQDDFRKKFLPEPIPPTLTAGMIREEFKHMSFTNLNPPAILVEKHGDTITKAIESLNQINKTPTGKCFMTKDQAFVPHVKTKPDNANEADWKQRRQLTTAAIKQAYGSNHVQSLQAETFENLLLVENNNYKANQPKILTKQGEKKHAAKSLSEKDLEDLKNNFMNNTVKLASLLNKEKKNKKFMGITFKPHPNTIQQISAIGIKNAYNDHEFKKVAKLLEKKSHRLPRFSEKNAELISFYNQQYHHLEKLQGLMKENTVTNKKSFNPFAKKAK